MQQQTFTSESVSYTTYPHRKLCNSHSGPTVRDENTVFSWHYLSLSSGRHGNFQPLMTAVGLSPPYFHYSNLHARQITCRMKIKSVFNKR